MAIIIAMAISHTTCCWKVLDCMNLSLTMSTPHEVLPTEKLEIKFIYRIIFC